jgi:uncharacterized protein (TIGR00369 family)
MKKEICNPYQTIDGYNCFGCSSENRFGLKMHFIEEEDGLYSYWKPEEHFQGWIGILHGGIQATLLDEIASWVVFVKLGKSGVTSELKIRYKKAVEMKKTPLFIKGVMREMQRNIAVIDTYLYDSEGILCAQGECKYFTFSDETGKRDYYYPGKEAFYK